MKTTMFEPLLTNATIKAIDNVSKKFTKAGSEAEHGVTKLLSHWNNMDLAEKEHVVGIVIATATTAVTAIVALRRRAKSPLKTAGRALVKKVTKR